MVKAGSVRETQNPSGAATRKHRNASKEDGLATRYPRRGYTPQGSYPTERLSILDEYQGGTAGDAALVPEWDGSFLFCDQLQIEIGGL
jgi:hypothetical protein